MDHTFITSGVTISAHQIRDGRYGPVFAALESSRGHLVTAELLDESCFRSDPQSLVSYLKEAAHRIMPSKPHPSVVFCLGFQQTIGGVHILTEWEAAGTLRDVLCAHGAMAPSVVRCYVRSIVAGVVELRRRGLKAVFLDAESIVLGLDGVAKVEAPLMEVTRYRWELPLAMATLPGLEVCLGDLQKADVWLLGVVVAEMLTGEGISEVSVGEVADRVEEMEGSAWEVFVPPEVAEGLGEDVVDFVRLCFCL